MFLARARAAGIPTSGLFGIELDPEAARAAQHQIDGIHLPGPAKPYHSPRSARVHCGDLFAVTTAEFGHKFDAVVGNPPYVRQERLTRQQKERIRQCLADDFPTIPASELDAVVGRGDLAAACVLRALAFARPGARIALVVSSALLDAGYANRLWQAAARAGQVLALVDAPGERWFADAAVNPVILVMQVPVRPRSATWPDARPGEPPASKPPAPAITIARLTVSTAEAARALARSACDDPLDALASVADVRQASPSTPGHWARYLRAPAVWFEFERACGDALVPLSTIAEVKRGVTSGANDVFYLDRAQAATLAIEPQVLLPLLRSPRQVLQIDVDPDQLDQFALVCPHDDRSLSRYPKARQYLDDHRDTAGRPTLRGRNPWWALPAQPARLFLTKAYGERFVQRLARTPVLADQRVYAVHPRPTMQARPPARTPRHPAHPLDVQLLAAILNSTFTTLALESLGRASLGEGALEWTVADAASLPVLDPRQYDARAQRQVCAALDRLARRSIGPVAAEHTMPDRADLDRALATIRPGLSEILELAWPALIHSVERRNTRRHRPLEITR